MDPANDALRKYDAEGRQKELELEPQKTKDEQKVLLEEIEAYDKEVEELEKEIAEFERRTDELNLRRAIITAKHDSLREKEEKLLPELVKQREDMSKLNEMRRVMAEAYKRRMAALERVKEKDEARLYSDPHFAQYLELEIEDLQNVNAPSTRTNHKRLQESAGPSCTDSHKKKPRQNEKNEAGVGKTLEWRTATALELPEILNQIFKHLPNPALLTCSLVCKAWNKESRYFLRDSRTLKAVIKGPDPCVKLLEFEALLATMTVVPFSGLKVDVTKDTSSMYCLRPVDYDTLYPSIQEKMALKYLRVKWIGNHEANEDCAAILYLRRCFRMGLHLKHVGIVSLPETVDLYSTEVIDDDELELPNLRVLAYSGDGSDSAMSAVFRLVKAAPKLEQIRTTVSPKDMDIFPPDKLKCITELDFLPEDESHLEFLEQMALAGAQLRRLYVCREEEEEIFYSDRMWRILRLILECCCKQTLRYLALDLVPALKLMNLQVSLEGLKQLEISRLQSQHHPDLELIPLLRHINLGALFPALRGLGLDLSPSSYREDELETAQELAQGEQFSWMYQGVLTMFLSTDEEEPPYQCAAATFPNIRTLDIRALSHDPRYALLWELRSGLEFLNIKTTTLNKGSSPCFTPFLNLDGEFCGINPEEVAVLQEMDNEFLEKVHIVPTKPAITCLRNLKNFRLEVAATIPNDLPAAASNLLLLSKVTGFLAFRRMPGVNIYLDFSQNTSTEFEHLAPFVTLRRLQA